MLIRFRLTAGKHYARADGRSVIVYLKGGKDKKETGQHRLLPGDIIECYPEMLKHIMDRFTQIDPDPPPAEPTAGLFLVDLGDDTFNVINENTGLPVNDVPVSRETALSMVNRTSLEDEEPAKDENDEDEEQEIDDDNGEMEDDRIVEA
jgi:hypothetical protein